MPVSNIAFYINTFLLSFFFSSTIFFFHIRFQVSYLFQSQFLNFSSFMHSKSTANAVVTLPSLRSTLQKYGLQHLLKNTSSSSSPTPPLTPFQKPVLSVSSCDRQDQATNKVQQPEASHEQPEASHEQQAVIEIYQALVRKPMVNTVPKRQCSYTGCSQMSHKVRCPIHKIVYPCKFQGCFKCPRKGGFCRAHGGGETCTTLRCRSRAIYIVGGKCYTHGAAFRCSIRKCLSTRKIDGLCQKHYNAR